MSPGSLAAYMQLQRFLPLFVVTWIGISAFLSFYSGWSSLARRFRANAAASGQHFRLVSGALGLSYLPVNYGGCLFVTVNNTGLHLSILFPFRLMSPPLFIPWSQVQSVDAKRVLFGQTMVIQIRNEWAMISIRGVAGERIRETYAGAFLHRTH